jgi:hypothetical protein
MAGERGSGINTGTCVDLVLIPVPPVPLEFFCMKFLEIFISCNMKK